MNDLLLLTNLTSIGQSNIFGQDACKVMANNCGEMVVASNTVGWVVFVGTATCIVLFLIILYFITKNKGGKDGSVQSLPDAAGNKDDSQRV